MGSLVPLTGLAELTLSLYQTAVVPAALGQLKGLRLLKVCGCDPCALEAGCFNLPGLQRLDLEGCMIGHAAGLPSFSTLQSLTRIRFSGGQGAPLFAQLVQLPKLLQMDFAVTWNLSDRLEASRLPTDMGALSLALQVLTIRGNNLTQFPLALAQLRALVCLDASENCFAGLPAGITALSRLTELRLGRPMPDDRVQLRGTCPLDVRALGDLSAFPALCKLSFAYCEVVLCASLLGAVRHASLASLSFWYAHPAPLCRGVVLQLGQGLRRENQGSVLTVQNSYNREGRFSERSPHGRAPTHNFVAALEACGL